MEEPLPLSSWEAGGSGSLDRSGWREETLRRERPFKDALFLSCPLELIPQDLLRAPSAPTPSMAVEFTP